MPLKFRKQLGEIVLQIIPVMIGVYLGFLVSNWSESNSTKLKSKTLITNVFLEIERNQERLENIIDYHILLRDSSRFYSQTQNRILRPRFFEGARLQDLSSSAFDTGIQTGIINELAIDKIQMLNELYTYQNSHKEFCTMLMSELISKDFSAAEEDIKRIARFLGLTMTDVVIQESELIELYKTTKERLKLE